MHSEDTFFTQSNCDRCSNDLSVRTMSWFNDDTICMTCSGKEKEIKRALREKGYKDAMEGCGFIPDPDQLPTECVGT